MTEQPVPVRPTSSLRFSLKFCHLFYHAANWNSRFLNSLRCGWLCLEEAATSLCAWPKSHPPPRRYSTIPVEIREMGQCEWEQVEGSFPLPQDGALISGPWDLFRLTSGPDPHPIKNFRVWRFPFRGVYGQSYSFVTRELFYCLGHGQTRQWVCPKAACLESFIQSVFIELRLCPRSWACSCHQQTQRSCLQEVYILVEDGDLKVCSWCPHNI